MGEGYDPSGASLNHDDVEFFNNIVGAGVTAWWNWLINISGYAPNIRDCTLYVTSNNPVEVVASGGDRALAESTRRESGQLAGTFVVTEAPQLY